jgi:GNAT superfamily N-acetyltransferase
MGPPASVDQTKSTLRVCLEPAAAEDVPTILPWMKDFYAHEGVPFDPAVSEPVLRELLAHPDFGRVFKLTVDGHEVGYAVMALAFSLEFGGRSVFLDELYVQPASRGRGIGSIALHLLQKTARDLGARSLALEVDFENPRAESLYRREGFTSNGRQLMTRRL